MHATTFPMVAALAFSAAIAQAEPTTSLSLTVDIGTGAESDFKLLGTRQKRHALNRAACECGTELTLRIRPEGLDAQSEDGDKNVYLRVGSNCATTDSSACDFEPVPLRALLSGAVYKTFPADQLASPEKVGCPELPFCHEQPLRHH